VALPVNQYTSAAQQAATKHGVPVEVLFGTLEQESSWNPSAVNYNDNGTMDYGIAQLNTKYYPDAYTMTPEQQIDKAASILASNYKATGNWYDAARAYNAGLKGATDDPNAGKAHADNVWGRIKGWLGEAFSLPEGNFSHGLTPGVSDDIASSPTLQKVQQWIIDNTALVAVLAMGLLVVFFSTGEAVKGK
jgi:hypothetical protein